MFSTAPLTKSRCFNVNCSAAGPAPAARPAAGTGAPAGGGQGRPAASLPDARRAPRSTAGPGRPPREAGGSGCSPRPPPPGCAAGQEKGHKSQSQEQLELGAAFTVKAEARYLRLLLKPNVRFNKGDKSMSAALPLRALRCQRCQHLLGSSPVNTLPWGQKRAPVPAGTASTECCHQTRHAQSRRPQTHSFWPQPPHLPKNCFPTAAPQQPPGPGSLPPPGLTSPRWHAAFDACSCMSDMCHLISASVPQSEKGERVRPN